MVYNMHTTRNNYWRCTTKTGSSELVNNFYALQVPDTVCIVLIIRGVSLKTTIWLTSAVILMW